ncbi:C-reactive protein [Coregonus clupeaformis]|uniref:C-reactive protein n=1 Tax=Coregonus clupeaformis TaxID=59861 RepID=UPI001BE0553B|nr:C-reactive protein [Coregonus clupeaformis]
MCPYPMEKFLLVLVVITTCCAVLQDLSGKMFTFPKETNTAQVSLMTSRETFTAITVCLRFFTDLRRNHILFSLATPTKGDAFVLFKRTAAGELEQRSKHGVAIFDGQDYTLNTWHSICATWASETGLGQLWLDGKPSTRKFLQSEAIKGKTIILGQELFKFGRFFARQQSFVGMLTDVHMWDNLQSPYDIQRYTNQTNFTPGNVLSWRALNYQISGQVLLENKQSN